MSGKLSIAFVFVTALFLTSNASSVMYCQSKPTSVTALDHIIDQANQRYGKSKSLPTKTLSTEIGKCGLQPQFAIRQHWNEFTESQRQQLSSISQPPQTETGIRANFLLSKIR